MPNRENVTVTRPEPGLRVVLAPNPSPMTFRGTNSYIVGVGNVAVIDPGPALPAHQDALLAALEPGERVSHIIVTHTHLDHSPLARPLAAATGAPILAFGTHEDGRSEIMTQLATSGLAGGGEGVDRSFDPDQRLADGDLVQGDGWCLEVLHTPGHTANHIALVWKDALFTGDHVMGWASSLISPPDGDLTAFMASCSKLSARNDRVYYPGHGDPVDDPMGRLSWLMAHRRTREAQILEEVSRGFATVEDIATRIYTDTPLALLPAAERNVFAHLIDLCERNLVTCTQPIGFTSYFRTPAPHSQTI